jgi:hypothetical protein
MINVFGLVKRKDSNSSIKLIYQKSVIFLKLSINFQMNYILKLVKTFNLNLLQRKKLKTYN